MPVSDLIMRVFERSGQMGLRNDLARHSGLPEERIRSIEAGDPASAMEYELLCRAVAVDPVAMFRGKDSDPRRTPVRFRTALSSDHPDSDDIRLLALAAEQGRILSHLLELLGEDVRLEKHRRVLGVNGTTEPWRDGYELGEHDRNSLHPSKGPIENMEQMLRDLGIHVARVSLSSPDVDAASIWEPGAVPVILINKNGRQTKHPGALRATFAHELCHLLHDAGKYDLTTNVSWGEEDKGNYAEEIEKRARAFAPSFLAPKTQTSEWASSLKHGTRNDAKKLVVSLAEHWGLSFEGAAWHAKNCELIDTNTTEEILCQKKPSFSLETFESMAEFTPPAMLDSTLPLKPAPLWDGWATILVLSSLDEGCITVGRARELLTWG